MDFRPFYYDLSTNKVISGNSYYEIINNLPIKQFNNFCNFQDKKYFILAYNKLFINRVSSICTVKYKALSLHVASSGCTADRGLCILQYRPRTRLISSKYKKNFSVSKTSKRTEFFFGSDTLTNNTKKWG